MSRQVWRRLIRHDGVPVPTVHEIDSGVIWLQITQCSVYLLVGRAPLQIRLSSVPFVSEMSQYRPKALERSVGFSQVINNG